MVLFMLLNNWVIFVMNKIIVVVGFLGIGISYKMKLCIFNWCLIYIYFLIGVGKSVFVSWFEFMFCVINFCKFCSSGCIFLFNII